MFHICFFSKQELLKGPGPNIRTRVTIASAFGCMLNLLDMANIWISDQTSIVPKYFTMLL